MFYLSFYFFYYTLCVVSIIILFMISCCWVYACMRLVSYSFLYTTDGFENLPLRIFFNLGIPTESCDTAPYYGWKVLIAEFFWYTEGFLYEMFRYCERKQFRRKIVIRAPSLIPNSFQYQKFSETQKGSSTNFSVLWDKIFSMENRDTPSPFLPFLIHKVFRYQKFSEAQKGPSTKSFGTVRQQIFDGNSWYFLHKL